MIVIFIKVSVCLASPGSMAPSSKKMEGESLGPRLLSVVELKKHFLHTVNQNNGKSFYKRCDQMPLSHYTSFYE